MCQVKTLSIGGRFQLLRNLSPGKKGSFVENIGAIDKEKTFTFRLMERMVRGVVVSGGCKKGKKKRGRDCSLEHIFVSSSLEHFC